MAKANDEPKELTAVEKLEALETKIRLVSAQVKAGSKSDIDQVGSRLDEFADAVKEILERKTS